MYQLSEVNKAHFVQHNQHYVKEFYNGTRWSEENEHRLEKMGVGGTWAKPVYLKELMHNLTNSTVQQQQKKQQPRVDWILYMYSDAMIVNFDFDLRCILPPLSISVATNNNDNIAMVLSQDAESINTGSFLIRVNDYGREIVDAWAGGYNNGRVDDQDYLIGMFDGEGSLKKEYSKSEQNNERPRPKLQITRPCSLNSGGGIETPKGHWMPYFEGVYVKGDFAVHFFGRKDKLEQMKSVDDGGLGFFSR